MINKNVFYAGLLASIVMGAVQMMYEGIWGAGFWSPPVFIAATILRNLQAASIPVAFTAMPVILGLMGHMMNSVILGIIFTLIFSKMNNMAGLLVSGMAYALAVFLFMWFAVLPVVDPVMLKLNAGAFVLAHLMWGLTLGAALWVFGKKKAVA